MLASANDATWESEALGDKAAARLRSLAELLRASETISLESVPSWIAKNFRGGRLRPQKLTTAFNDDVFTVLRPEEAEFGNTGGSEYEDTSGFLSAIRELLEPFENGKQLRLETKVVRVEADGSKLRTVALMHLFGHASRGNVQQNTSWDCLWRRGADGELTLLSLHATDFEEIHAAKSESPLFADCTEAALGASPYYQQVLARGLDHWLDRIETQYGIDPSGWEGIALGDANGDGRDDVYACQPGGISNALFIQSADGTLKNVAPAAGLDLLDQTHAALFVDLDNDGDQDLAVAISLGVVIFSNDGQGKFTRRTAQLTPEGMPFSLSAADYDDDGDLDLYACCYSRRGSVVSHQFLGRPIPYHDANNGARNLLLRNNRRWRFQDVTRRTGLDQNNRRFSFAASWEDYDNDGDLDLYVANDYGRNNLYRNDAGTFSDVAPQAGVEDISAGMSVSWGDIDHDGWMDLYVSNMFSSAGNRVAYQRQFHSAADAGTRAEFQRHARGNSLFSNAGDGTFRDISESAAVTMGRWAWGSTLADLNNDGSKDIFVANGFLTQELPDDL